MPGVAYPLTAAILNDREVSKGFDQMVARSGHGKLPIESAAFLVIDEKGAFSLVQWPSTNRYHQQQWTGAIPSGTVAVVHTHPANLPYASTHDREEARRIGMPILILTPGTVVAVDGREGRQLFAAKM